MYRYRVQGVEFRVQGFAFSPIIVSFFRTGTVQSNHRYVLKTSKNSQGLTYYIANRVYSKCPAHLRFRVPRAFGFFMLGF